MIHRVEQDKVFGKDAKEAWVMHGICTPIPTWLVWLLEMQGMEKRAQIPAPSQSHSSVSGYVIAACCRDDADDAADKRKKENLSSYLHLTVNSPLPELDSSVTADPV